MKVPKHKDPNSDANSSKWHTGKECIEKGCQLPAGTAWSDYWCWSHNSERLDRISKSLEGINKKLNG